MTVYLVDFENVRSEGLRGVENLSADDKVVVFYSKNADAISLDVCMLLNRSKADIETFRILRGGRNSLDFQLSTYLGYLVMENCYRKIYIVSEDKGFLCAISFWEENSELCNAQIRLCKSVANADKENSTSEAYDDGLTGKFLEKVDVKLRALESTNEEKCEKKKEPKPKESIFKGFSLKKTQKQNGLKRDIQKKDSSKKDDSKKDSSKKESSKKDSSKKDNSKKENLNKDIPKLVSRKQEHPNQKNIQNPTSKNKIFTAEIKTNITEDVRELVNGKCSEETVPVLVEAIGLSTGKQHFYRMLVSKFGQEKGQEFYTSIKGQYANLKRK